VEKYIAQRLPPMSASTSTMTKNARALRRLDRRFRARRVREGVGFRPVLRRTVAVAVIAPPQ
jgi:hypothetical protein